MSKNKRISNIANVCIGVASIISICIGGYLAIKSNPLYEDFITGGIIGLILIYFND